MSPAIRAYRDALNQIPAFIKLAKDDAAALSLLANSYNKIPDNTRDGGVDLYRILFTTALVMILNAREGELVEETEEFSLFKDSLILIQKSIPQIIYTLLGIFFRQNLDDSLGHDIAPNRHNAAITSHIVTLVTALSADARNEIIDDLLWSAGYSNEESNESIQLTYEKASELLEQLRLSPKDSLNVIAHLEEECYISFDVADRLASRPNLELYQLSTETQQPFFREHFEEFASRNDPAIIAAGAKGILTERERIDSRSYSNLNPKDKKSIHHLRELGVELQNRLFLVGCAQQELTSIEFRVQLLEVILNINYVKAIDAKALIKSIADLFNKLAGRVHAEAAVLLLSLPSELISDLFSHLNDSIERFLNKKIAETIGLRVRSSKQIGVVCYHAWRMVPEARAAFVDAQLDEVNNKLNQKWLSSLNRFRLVKAFFWNLINVLNLGVVLTDERLTEIEELLIKQGKYLLDSSFNFELYKLAEYDWHQQLIALAKKVRRKSSSIKICSQVLSAYGQLCRQVTNGKQLVASLRKTNADIFAVSLLRTLLELQGVSAIDVVAFARILLVEPEILIVLKFDLAPFFEAITDESDNPFAAAAYVFLLIHLMMLPGLKGRGKQYLGNNPRFLLPTLKGLHTLLTELDPSQYLAIRIPLTHNDSIPWILKLAIDRGEKPLESNELNLKKLPLPLLSCHLQQAVMRQSFDVLPELAIHFRMQMDDYRGQEYVATLIFQSLLIALMHFDIQKIAVDFLNQLFAEYEFTEEAWPELSRQPYLARLLLIYATYDQAHTPFFLDAMESCLSHVEGQLKGIEDHIGQRKLTEEEAEQEKSKWVGVRSTMTLMLK